VPSRQRNGYFVRRKENAEALTDLAIGSFIEMRDKTPLPLNAHPSTFIPYSLAARRARRQDSIVYACLIAAVMLIIALSMFLSR